MCRNVNTLSPHIILRKCNAESQENVHKRSSLKEDESALLVYLYLLVCVLSWVIYWPLWAYFIQELQISKGGLRTKCNLADFFNVVRILQCGLIWFIDVDFGVRNVVTNRYTLCLTSFPLPPSITIKVNRRRSILSFLVTAAPSEFGNNKTRTIFYPQQKEPSAVQN